MRISVRRGARGPPSRSALSTRVIAASTTLRKASRCCCAAYMCLTASSGKNARRTQPRTEPAARSRRRSARPGSSIRAQSLFRLPSPDGYLFHSQGVTHLTGFSQLWTHAEPMWRRVGLGVGLVFMVGLSSACGVVDDRAASRFFACACADKGACAESNSGACGCAAISGGSGHRAVDQRTGAAQRARGARPRRQGAVQARISRDFEQRLAEGLKGSGIAVLEVIDVSPLCISQAHRQRLRHRAAGPDRSAGRQRRLHAVELVRLVQVGRRAAPRPAGAHCASSFRGQAEERKQATFISHRVQVRPNLARLILGFHHTTRAVASHGYCDPG